LEELYYNVDPMRAGLCGRDWFYQTFFNNNQNLCYLDKGHDSQDDY